MLCHMIYCSTHCTFLLTINSALPIDIALEKKGVAVSLLFLSIINLYIIVFKVVLK